MPENPDFVWLYVRSSGFTLRCVEEYALGKGIAHEEIYGEAWVVDQPHNISPKEAVELRYEPPIDARSTQLSGDKPVFWELEVTLDLPGLDFEQTYLVPIYGSKSIASIKPILQNR